MRYLISLLCTLYVALIHVTPASSIQSPASILPDSLSVGMVTCYPGPDIFELYGHEAVRVSGRLNNQPVDVIFNYGIFDFDSPGFVYRFVKGETDYMICSQPTDLFLYGYKQRGSRVVEKKLPLTNAEAQALLARLIADTRPGNNTYRYKYFSANCATNPLEHVNAVTEGRLFQDDKEIPPTAPTYRDLLREYNHGYPWYQFGIDLVLGSELDKPVSRTQASFIPMELNRLLFSEMPEEVLVEGDGDMRQAPTPIILSPLFVAWLLLAGAVCFVVMNWHSRVVYTVWFALQGLAGLLVCYLVFFSEHEGTSPNSLVWWLNPLWLAIPIMVWIPRCHKACDYMLWLDAGITTLLMAVWPFLPQSTNVAVFPLMGVTILLGFTCRYWQRS